MQDLITRRGFVVGAAVATSGLESALRAQSAPNPNAQLGTPPSVITNPPRIFGPGAPPAIAPDPDVINLDPSFAQLRIGQATIKRISTGYELTEGPAWSAQGQYAIFSDVKQDRLYRYIWETGEVTIFRQPSYGCNGNAFDHQGRQISNQDFFRRVVRWEHDGSLTVLADKFDGRPLNSPNDVAAHIDGSVWFTDPVFGGTIAEGHPDEGEGPMNPGGARDAHLGDRGTGLIGSMHQVLPLNVYRIDPSGRVDLVLPYQEKMAPNGICFSPDYTKVYVVRGGGISLADIAGSRIVNLREFADCMVDGLHCGPDGIRADKAGNIWCSSSAVLGYAGVTI